MRELKLLPFGDPKLKTPPKEFDFDGEEDPVELKKDLLAAMYKAGGVGLSANQVGLDYKVFVIGGSGVDTKVVFNPILVDVSNDMITMREGCLSYPGLWLNISRPNGAIFKYQDEEGVEVVEEFRGIPARVMLHEYDHMLGQNFTMRASKLKIDRAIKQLDKKVKRFKQKNGVLR